MEISIEGKKYINSDTYDNLIISNKKTNPDCILITAGIKNDIDIPNIMSRNGITEFIKENEPENQVESLVDYHLNNNRVRLIKCSDKLEVLSTNEKRFVYKANVQDENFTIRLYKKIFSQYQLDRYAFLNKHAENKEYEFRADEQASYELINGKICISLYRNKEWNVIDSEQRFLLEFIQQKLHEKDCKAMLLYFEKCLCSIGDKPPLPYYQILCGDLSIQIYGAEKDFKTAIVNLVNFYNFNREYQLKRKLNMEGYYE